MITIPLRQKCLILLSLLFVMTAATLLPATAMAQTAYEHLNQETKPVFKQGHTLPVLSRWGWQMDTQTRIELADHWGYGLELGNITNAFVDKLIAEPESDDAKLVKMAKEQPDKYKLAVMTWRPLLGNVLNKAAKTDPKLAEQIKATRVRDADGNQPEGPDWKMWSPLAPMDLFNMAAKESSEPLKRLRELAPIAIVMNGGEYGMHPYGHSGKYWAMDPNVVAAKGEMSWYEFASMKKHDQEAPISKAIRDAVPDRQMFVFYHFGGVPTWDSWTWSTDAKYTMKLADVPTQSLYYKHFNTGWTGKKNLLTHFLITVAQAIELDAPLSYNWYCAGWGERAYSDQDRYMGFLKANYAAGTIGGVAGFFSRPKAGFAADLGEETPSWLWQMEDLGRVHALYSHLEDLIRNGDLLKGDIVEDPNKPDKRYQGLPRYEFNTQDENARVIIRKHKTKDLWLACAWAADGDARSVSVNVPDLGEVELEARPAGSVYLITHSLPIQYEPPVVKATLIDLDAMLPSQKAGEQVAKALKDLKPAK